MNNRSETRRVSTLNGLLRNAVLRHLKCKKGVKSSLGKYSEIFDFGHFKNVHFSFSWRTFSFVFFKKCVESIMQQNRFFIFKLLP
jgi:hypothetical protein